MLLLIKELQLKQITLMIQMFGYTHLNNAGIVDKIWTQVDSVEGNNAPYNSVNKSIRDFYVVPNKR